MSKRKKYFTSKVKTQQIYNLNIIIYLVTVKCRNYINICNMYLVMSVMHDRYV